MTARQQVVALMRRHGFLAAAQTMEWAEMDCPASLLVEWRRFHERETRR